MPLTLNLTHISSLCKLMPLTLNLTAAGGDGGSGTVYAAGGYQVRFTCITRMSRAGQNTVYTRCMYGIFGRGINKYIWSYTVYINTVLASPRHMLRGFTEWSNVFS